ncbi:lysine-sensitive aspartokinase 3 [Rheinheimera salexigens]|uniref:Aspartokinase n=4 Tax=Rheinheimera salexigens TaxID=1628148 RepID=A0A1E7Q9Z0_9GAMM|nr:lysine-sensitive aspartokinase 3 [Rheinheimera salexigens]
MSRCADIVLSQPAIRVVVVSACTGVTNLLVDITQFSSVDARLSAYSGIENITFAVIAKLKQTDGVMASTQALLQRLKHLVEQHDHVYSAAEKDEIVSFGERLSSVLFSQVLLERNIAACCFDVRQVMRTDSHFGKAEPNIKAIKVLCLEKLTPLLAESVVVTQGFVGANELDQTTTLGRGGSDYSAALLAEALAADVVQIWTDVVGIFTTDPRLTEHARCIKEISFDEAAEMATFGARVIHPATLLPAIRQNIAVFVGSSREPESGGTWIAKEVAERPAYRAIALRKSQTLITLKSPEMLHAAGFLTRVFDILSRHEISIDLVTTSEISVALTLDQGGMTTAFSSDIDLALFELEKFCDVTVERGLSLVAVIGNHLHSNQGVTGELFNTLERINMRLICHGASKHNLCFLVQDTEAVDVVKQLHQSLFAA